MWLEHMTAWRLMKLPHTELKTKSPSYLDADTSSQTEARQDFHIRRSFLFSKDHRTTILPSCDVSFILKSS
jgi:hypothetical protein